MRIVKNVMREGKDSKCVKCGSIATHRVLTDGKYFPVCELHKPTLLELLKANGYIVDLKGKQFVLFSGLLDLSHRNGLETMSSEIVELDRESKFALVKATVTGTRGTFSAYGDADPSNTGKLVMTAYIRMAETRAYARCLRLFLGTGMTCREELPPAEKK